MFLSYMAYVTKPAQLPFDPSFVEPLIKSTTKRSKPKTPKKRNKPVRKSPPKKVQKKPKRKLPWKV